MSKPKISIYNHETGETEIREMTDAEIEQLKPKSLPEGDFVLPRQDESGTL